MVHACGSLTSGLYFIWRGRTSLCVQLWGKVMCTFRECEDIVPSYPPWTTVVVVNAVESLWFTAVLHVGPCRFFCLSQANTLYLSPIPNPQEVPDLQEKGK
ncbi:unnamed protein product [Dicrocoelium dendriticum]|nr:unnamed protein product [Dicrocoelium dendriticum]